MEARVGALENAEGVRTARDGAREAASDDRGNCRSAGGSDCGALEEHGCSNWGDVVQGVRLDGRLKWRYRNRGFGSGTKAAIYHVIIFLPSIVALPLWESGGVKMADIKRCRTARVENSSQ